MLDNAVFSACAQHMDRPKKGTDAWAAFSQACLRIAPPKWVDSWNQSRPSGKGPLQGGVLKHIITWLKDEEDQVNEVIVEFGNAWEAHKIVQKKGQLTGKSSGRKGHDGAMLENSFSFSVLSNNLAGLPIHDIKHLLKCCIKGAMTWQDVCTVRLFPAWCVPLNKMLIGSLQEAFKRVNLDKFFNTIHQTVVTQQPGEEQKWNKAYILVRFYQIPDSELFHFHDCPESGFACNAALQQRGGHRVGHDGPHEKALEKGHPKRVPHED